MYPEEILDFRKLLHLLFPTTSSSDGKRRYDQHNIENSGSKSRSEGLGAVPASHNFTAFS